MAMRPQKGDALLFWGGCGGCRQEGIARAAQAWSAGHERLQLRLAQPHPPVPCRPAKSIGQPTS